MSIEAESIKHLISLTRKLNNSYSVECQQQALQLLLNIEIDNSDTYMSDNLLTDIRNEIESKKYADALSALKTLYDGIAN